MAAKIHLGETDRAVFETVRGSAEVIIVKLMGGLGNQMFQYAAGRALAARLKTELQLDITGFDDMHPDDTPRQFELDCYKHKAVIANKTTLTRVKPGDCNPSIIERFQRLFSPNGPIFTYGQPSKSERLQINSVRNNTYIVGWWQDEFYFSDIREQLLADFTPAKKLSPAYKKYESKIKSSTTPVSLHVRRGDYVTNKHASKHHGLAPMTYYKKAIAYITDRVDDPAFFVFSDDIAWCKKNIKVPNVTFVEKTNGLEDMNLMSQCSHNIIANSSFSWWGAWLNQHNDKIIVTPKTWFQNKESDNATSIVPDKWIRL